MSWQVVVITAILTGGFFAFAIGAAVRAHLRQPTTGKEGLIGAQGKVTATLSGENEGEVAIVGELWRARSTQGSLVPGETVEVIGLDGLTLIVRPVTQTIADNVVVQ